MKEFINKLISELEECVEWDGYTLDIRDKMLKIVNKLAEEYKDKTNIINGLKAFLKDKFDYCAEQAEMNLEAECNSEIASYFRNRKELYLDRANIYGEVMRELGRLAEENKVGWIPCSEKLPEETVRSEIFVTEILKELDHVNKELYQLECKSQVDSYGYFSQRKGVELTKEIIEKVAEKYKKDGE